MTKDRWEFAEPVEHMLTERDAKLRSALEQIAQQHRPEIIDAVYATLMREYWRGRVSPFYSLKPPDGCEVDHHGRMLRSDPETGEYLYVTTKYHKLRQPREKTLVRLQAIPGSGIGSEHKPDEAGWETLARMRPRQYDPIDLLLDYFWVDINELSAWYRTLPREPTTASSEPKSRRRGRRADPVWPGIWAEISAMLAVNGRPNKQVEVEQWIFEAAEKRGKDFARSTVRSYASKLLDEYERKMNE